MTYATVEMWITNKEALAAYREKAGEALAKHGGSLVSASPNPSLLEGESSLPSMLAVLSFPDTEAAQAWIRDPELAPVHALRNKSGRSVVKLLG